MQTENSNRRNESWRLGKEIPIATIVVLAVQTASVIWWAASTSAKVEFMRETVVTTQVAQVAVDRRQDEEAQRAENRILLQLDKLNQKMDRLIEGGRR